MKRALVTGGCGFIGSHLTKRLIKEGWQVDIVDNMSGGSLEAIAGLKTRVLPNGSFLRPFYETVNRVEGQPMTSPAVHVERNQKTVLVIPDDFASDYILSHIQNGFYDVVFHQAAIPRVSYSVENPAETTYTNVFSTVRLFESCSGNVDRVVWASSSSVYGGADAMPTPETERGKRLPLSPYAWQKFTIEDYAKLSANLYGLDIVCLRYFNVFGPGQLGDSPYSTAVAAWCHAAKNGLPLRSDGDGEQTRDMCFVDNTVHANILAANSERKFSGECYNIACGSSVSNNQILDYFRANFDVSVRHAAERAGDVKHTLADITRATEDLGYSPLVTFWEGLEQTINWWNLS